MGKCISTTVDVDVYLSDFDDSDLIEELEDRGFTVRGYTVFVSNNNLLLTIYEKRKLGQDYSKDLDEMIWQTIGRM